MLFTSRNLLVVIAHFAWVIPAAMILSKVEGFFGKNVNRKNRATKTLNEAMVNESQRQLQTAKTREG